MTTPKSKSIVPLMVVLIAGACCLFPILGTAGGIGMFAAERAGMLSHWESLGAPPETPTEILGAAPFNVVYVKTKEGPIYSYDHSGRETKVWTLVNQPPKNYSSITPNTSVFQGQVPPPPGTAVNRLRAIHTYGELMTESHYVILADGTVWVWKYDLIGLFPLVGNMMLGFFIGAILTVPIALIIVIIISVRRLLARRAAQV